MGITVATLFEARVRETLHLMGLSQEITLASRLIKGLTGVVPIKDRPADWEDMPGTVLQWMHPEIIIERLDITDPDDARKMLACFTAVADAMGVQLQLHPDPTDPMIGELMAAARTVGFGDLGAQAEGMMTRPARELTWAQFLAMVSETEHFLHHVGREQAFANTASAFECYETWREDLRYRDLATLQGWETSQTSFADPVKFHRADVTVWNSHKGWLARTFDEETNRYNGVVRSYGYGEPGLRAALEAEAPAVTHDQGRPRMEIDGPTP